MKIIRRSDLDFAIDDFFEWKNRKFRKFFRKQTWIHQPLSYETTNKSIEMKEIWKIGKLFIFPFYIIPLDFFFSLMKIFTFYIQAVFYTLSIDHLYVSFELISTCDISNRFIFLPSKKSVENFIRFECFWRKCVDLSKNNLTIIRKTDRHDIIFIRDFFIIKENSRNFNSLKQKYFFIFQNLNLNRRDIFEKNGNEI